HWVPDHDLLFQRLFAALKPGGQLVAQCGGQGNIDRLRKLAAEVAAEQPYADALTGWTDPWNYASPDATRERLEHAGFDQIETWLEPWPVDPPEPREYLRTVCLGHHLAALPDALRDPFLDDVVRRYGQPPTLEYVRLNMKARRPTGRSRPTSHAVSPSIE
ncbi:MAG TPA: hypothetical protein VFT35_00325, partial [Gaiellaceae bacterium]|nr:hypothetical protein [Gaiellaceae bacterium]